MVQVPTISQEGILAMMTLVRWMGEWRVLGRNQAMKMILSKASEVKG